MKLAFALSGSRNAATAVEVARTVEAAGLDEVWVTEDYCERGAFSLAGALLATTSRVAVGIGVVNPWTRHPMLTAMEAGCLNELAPGRLLLGLGASNPHWMDHQLGIPFEQPLTRLRESVEILRLALSGEPVVHEGTAQSIDTQLSFSPGTPPIILGVKGPKALALAGAVADGVLLSVLSSPQYVRWAQQQLGSRQDLALASYIAVRIGDDRHAVRERTRPFVAKFLGVHGVHPITEQAGIPPELAQQFRQGWQAGTPRSDLVTDQILDTVAIAGDRDDVAAGLRRFADAGLATAVIHEEVTQDQTRMLDQVQAAAVDAGLSPGAGVVAS
ncbi:LLM class flavin-dependent oxidoreductase [Euzebya tangerina]|uniref:LLM class flavin-dependent oxidoreductase n=1 Tax=Euzebya tangerina TaxID=591198 RepID=UPI000E3200B7|nr:LLM class flavin-dependent oxidoreductase [Euzebya tangerina]